MVFWNRLKELVHYHTLLLTGGVTRWCNGSYRSVSHHETADVRLYLSFLPHTACAFTSYSEGNGASGFTLVPITGRSQTDTGRVKCQEHLVDVKG